MKHYELKSRVNTETQRIRSLWHKSFFLPFNPEEYDLIHVSKVGLTPGPKIHCTFSLTFNATTQEKYQKRLDKHVFF